jgi:hypothetical protein
MKRNNKERPTDITFWLRNGCPVSYRARVPADNELSIGRTDSKRGLGFVVSRGDTSLDFVLNKDQVAELAAFLTHCVLGGLRQPLGRKPNQMSLVAMHSPKRRLYMELDDAATKAHPGWRDLGEGAFESDDGAPSGKALVAWFKRKYPRRAARIERDINKALWEG